MQLFIFYFSIVPFIKTSGIIYHLRYKISPLVHRIHGICFLSHSRFIFFSQSLFTPTFLECQFEMEVCMNVPLREYITLIYCKNEV